MPQVKERSSRSTCAETGCYARRRGFRWSRARRRLSRGASDMLTWENSGFSVDASVRITLNGIQLRVYC